MKERLIFMITPSGIAPKAGCKHTVLEVEIVFDDRARTLTILVGKNTLKGARSETARTIKAVMDIFSKETRRVLHWPLPKEVRTRFSEAFRKFTRGLIPER